MVRDEINSKIKCVHMVTTHIVWEKRNIQISSIFVWFENVVLDLLDCFI